MIRSMVPTLREATLFASLVALSEREREDFSHNALVEYKYSYMQQILEKNYDTHA